MIYYDFELKELQRRMNILQMNTIDRKQLV